jgi:hypothetical protein
VDRAKTAVLGLALLLAVSACTTATVIRTPVSRTTSEPTYEDSKEFFLLGALGPSHVLNTDQLCLGKEVDQIQTVYTDLDVVVGVFTLGIYTPRTLRLWCAL